MIKTRFFRLVVSQKSSSTDTPDPSRINIAGAPERFQLTPAFTERCSASRRFGAAWSALRLEPSWMTETFPPTWPYAFNLFPRHADQLLAELDAATSTRAQVERRLLPELQAGTVSMDRTARQMGRDLRPTPR